MNRLKPEQIVEVYFEKIRFVTELHRAFRTFYGQHNPLIKQAVRVVIRVDLKFF